MSDLESPLNAVYHHKNVEKGTVQIAIFIVFYLQGFHLFIEVSSLQKQIRIFPSQLKNMTMRVVHILSLLIFISIFDEWNVEGKGMRLPCCGSLRCDSCRSGTRCLFCTYLIAFHLGFSNWVSDGSIPFKEPLIGMFDDIKQKLESNSQYFPQQTILGFFTETLDGLKNDCKQCNNHQEIVDVTEYIKQAGSRLSAIVGSSNWAFATAAIEEITKTLELLEKIPPELKVSASGNNVWPIT